MNNCNTELQSIKATIDGYIEARHTGNTEMPGAAFHPKVITYGANSKAVTAIKIEGLPGLAATNKSHSRAVNPINIL